MNKILIINYTLQMAGAEKLVYEICKFAKSNKLKPTILIPNSMQQEYYDEILKKNGVAVVRVKLVGIKNAIRSKNLNCIYWNILLRFGLKFKYQSLHFINLGLANRFQKKFIFKKKHFWHIGNLIQFPNYIYNFSEDLFKNKNNTIIYINRYQMDEIKKQYGDVKCKQILFKLFLTQP